MVSKIFFCSEFPDSPKKMWQRSRRRRRKAIAKCYAFQAIDPKQGNQLSTTLFNISNDSKSSFGNNPSHFPSPLEKKVQIKINILENYCNKW